MKHKAIHTFRRRRMSLKNWTNEKKHTLHAKTEDYTLAECKFDQTNREMSSRNKNWFLFLLVCVETWMYIWFPLLVSFGSFFLLSFFLWFRSRRRLTLYSPVCVRLFQFFFTHSKFVENKIKSEKNDDNVVFDACIVAFCFGVFKTTGKNYYVQFCIFFLFPLFFRYTPKKA